MIRIFACQILGIFSYTNARKIGYQWQNDFFSGNASAKPLTLTWKGNGNLSWTEIMTYLYPRHYNISLYRPKYETMEHASIMPFQESIAL